MAIDRTAGGATRRCGGGRGARGGARTSVWSPSSSVTSRANGGDGIAVAPAG